MDDYYSSVVMTDFKGAHINFNESENLISLKIKPFENSQTGEIMANMSKYLDFYAQSEIKNYTGEIKKKGKKHELVVCNKTILKKIGKPMKAFHNTLCVNDLSKFNMLNSDELHDDKLDIHTILNLIVTKCDTSKKSDCVTDK